MQRREDNVAARLNGNALQPLSDVAITVTDDKTGLPASLYSDNGVTPLAQPIVTDNNGYYGYYAANGEYTETFSSPRIATFTRKLVLADPDDNPHATKAELAAGSGSSLVTFTQAGTGAASRSLQARGRDMVSVKDFGAVGDGVTDDTAAIQAACNASRHVHFPEPASYYKITGQITLTPGALLTGLAKTEGNDTTVSIKYAGAAGAKMFACDSGNAYKGVGIEGLTLDGDNLAATGISLNTYRSKIRRNVLKNFTGAAIALLDSTVWAGENDISYNQISQCATGVSAGAKVFDGFLTKNIIFLCTNPVSLAVDAGWLVDGNHFYSSGLASPAFVTVADSGGARYIGNLFDTPPTNGMALTVNSVTCTTVISGNIFTGQAGTTNFITLNMVVTAKVYIGGNTFFATTGGSLAYCIQKSGAGTLAGTIGPNAFVNITQAKKFSVDAGCTTLDMDSGTLTTQFDNISMRNAKISVGFGAPSAADPTGSLYLAYNSSANADKGSLYYRYAGAWKKMPSLDKWHTDGTAAPTTGDWNQGDTVYNETPSELGTAGSKYIIEGWKCTVSGTPGTWVQMRTLTGN